MYDSSVKVLESAADAFIAAGVHLAKLHLLHSYHLGTICILSQMQIAGLHILPKAQKLSMMHFCSFPE